MSAVAAFLRRNPARVFAVLTALVALLVAYGVRVPPEWLGLAVAVLALFGGEAVQRVEDAKTAGAADDERGAP